MCIIDIVYPIQNIYLILNKREVMFYNNNVYFNINQYI